MDEDGQWGEEVMYNVSSPWQEDPGPGHYTGGRKRVHSAPPTPTGHAFNSSTTRNTQANLHQGRVSHSKL